MRNHVGKHILKGDISAHPNGCGFCGGLECTIGLQPYGYGASKRLNVVSKCDYFGILAFRRRALVIVIPVKIDQQNAQNVRIWYGHTI
jgi:hypothetical protein